MIPQYEIVISFFLIVLTLQVIYLGTKRTLKEILKKEKEELEKDYEVCRQFRNIAFWITLIIFTLLFIWNPIKHQKPQTEVGVTATEKEVMNIDENQLIQSILSKEKKESTLEEETKKSTLSYKQRLEELNDQKD